MFFSGNVRNFLLSSIYVAAPMRGQTIILVWSLKKFICNKKRKVKLNIKKTEHSLLSSTDNCIFRYRQSNVRGLIPASDYGRHAVIKSLSTIQTTNQCSAVVGSWEEPSDVWLTVGKNAFVGWALNFRFWLLLKDAVNTSDEKAI